MDRGSLGVATTVVTLGALFGGLGQGELWLSKSASHGLHWNRAYLLLPVVTATMVGVAVGTWMFASGYGLPLTVAIALLVPMTSVAGVWRYATIATGSSMLPAKSSLWSAVMRLVAIAAMFVVGAMSAWSVLGVQLGGVFLASALVLAPALALDGRPAESGAAPVPAMLGLGERLRGGLAFVVFGALTAVILRVDILAVERYSSPEALGTYAACIALSQSALVLSNVFRNRAQAGIAAGRGRRAITVEVRVMSVMVVLGGSVALIAAPWIASFLLGPGYPDGPEILRSTVVATAFLLFLDFAQGIQIATGKRRALVWAAALGAAVTVTCLLLFVPRFGPVGASFSVACGAGSAASINLWRALRDTARGAQGVSGGSPLASGEPFDGEAL
ncbi:lipopolysaccharide biosynthesis protein [Demequina capsici]|uniref:Polysaccharide biosynthesis C-terminal domain-containing protein n=1 Tax=Demequina capsici TaxID=3075620 RepID=A0AA96JDP8_9MICO|nr:polysaccharide biosynthesis C-terminal domain-containing protein [Demequina sp. OYTSA14]WNM24899.1 polysaccharide biosynthesis C-terminal domain-containing protein [Demequina sp. OYTSA14]